MTIEDQPGDEQSPAEAPAAEAPAAEAPAAEAGAAAPAEATPAEAPAPEAPASAPAVEAPAAPPAAEATAAPATAVPAAAEEAPAEQPQQRRGRRGKRQLSHGQAHIKATFNNTIITISDLEGRVVGWTSGGSVGFKGSRKSTPYAAQVAAEHAARKAGEMGIRKLDVIVRGSGSGRETAVRTLQTMGLEITGIKDTTPLPHNGCRPKKRKRG